MKLIILCLLLICIEDTPESEWRDLIILASIILIAFCL